MKKFKRFEKVKRIMVGDNLIGCEYRSSVIQLNTERIESIVPVTLHWFDPLMKEVTKLDAFEYTMFSRAKFIISNAKKVR
jgi:hypothetical protein